MDIPDRNAIAAQAALCVLRNGKAARTGKIPTCESRFKTPEHTAQRGNCTPRATGFYWLVAFSWLRSTKPLTCPIPVCYSVTSFAGDLLSAKWQEEWACP